MSYEWIKLHFKLRRHPKTLLLAHLLGVPRGVAFSYIVQAFSWCGEFRPTGVIRVRGPSADGPSLAADIEWTRGADALIEAFQQAGFLDDTDSNTGFAAFHDWDVEQGAHIIKAAKDAERKRKKRADVKNAVLAERPRTGRGQSAERPPRGAFSSQSPSRSQSLGGVGDSSARAPLSRGASGRKENDVPDFNFFPHAPTRGLEHSDATPALKAKAPSANFEGSAPNTWPERKAWVLALFTELTEEMHVKASARLSKAEEVELHLLVSKTDEYGRNWRAVMRFFFRRTLGPHGPDKKDLRILVKRSVWELHLPDAVLDAKAERS